MNPVLELISLDKVVDHPDNPRIVFRDDVIDGIAANLNGDYPQKHAIHVRPVEDEYQTLAGHHRRRAAIKAGLKQIWAWVEQLDDDAAFMELAVSNNQGELSPLEIGMHALKAVPTERGGRGKKGGLSEYAKALGKPKQNVSAYRQAAEVLTTNRHIDMTVFLDKAQHLAAIHSLPKECWQSCAESIGSASAADVRERVQSALAFLESPEIPEKWQSYLNLHTVASIVFRGTHAGNFRRLATTVQEISDWLLKRGHEDLDKQWRDWLVENSGGKSFDMRDVQAKRVELEQIAFDREEKPPVNDTPVQVLLADPPWQYDAAESGNRRIENKYPTATPEEIAEHIKSPVLFPRKLADNCVLYLWATAPKIREALQVMEAWGFDFKSSAVWDKERVGMGYWFRGQHELLLVGTRGKFSPPDQDKRVPSVFREKRDNKHSAKPDCVYDAIKAMFPDCERFEMYQREARDGWQGGGNESGT